MCGRMVPEEIVGKVVRAAFPVDSKLSFVVSVAYPVKTNVDCLGSTLLDCVIGDTRGAKRCQFGWGLSVVGVPFLQASVVRSIVPSLQL